ncbi:MAG: L-threonylcarbamoyladenylate synthase [Ignavibacteria bacterium]|nr:L-threonylcarbamoyladenylate synthase [Ignavibacteria bacterium]
MLGTNEIETIRKILSNDGVIAFPTETVYGIGCDIFSQKGVERIFALKKREAKKPLAAHVGSFEQIRQVGNTSVKYFDILANKFLPGPLAIIIPKLETVSNSVTCNFPSISIRFPDCEEFIQLALSFGRPIAATSANFSGEPSSIHHSQVKTYFEGKIDYIVEGGDTKYRKESTIIDLTKEKPTILRIGVIQPEELEEVLKMKLS